MGHAEGGFCFYMSLLFALLQFNEHYYFCNDKTVEYFFLLKYTVFVYFDCKEEMWTRTRNWVRMVELPPQYFFFQIYAFYFLTVRNT